MGQMQTPVYSHLGKEKFMISIEFQARGLVLTKLHSPLLILTFSSQDPLAFMVASCQ
jgi:hypothetical protein